MPAMLDDPAARTIYRQSGAPPYATAQSQQIPTQIHLRHVTLRDRTTVATLIPFSSPSQIPSSLLSYLSDQFNREIELGDTYPMIDPVPLENFGPYWFGNFGAVMVRGKIDGVNSLQDDRDWNRDCLGSFYVKPNYPGRSSHVCNGGFLVTDAARNRGVGRLMGECYLEWAPLLGYTYSVFNLVYETNVVSCRIWDSLGFKRIGRVKGCGNLRSYPDQLIDAIQYGRDLAPESEDLASEERFDKIKYYLRHNQYPTGADRAEKSRLRSAATHYKLADGDRLMLKDKEVISDPRQQYRIAQEIHVQSHGGINKTTANIAEKYHWVRIKETVSLVIRNCAACKEAQKVPAVRDENEPVSLQNEDLDVDADADADGHMEFEDDVSPMETSTGGPEAMTMEPDNPPIVSSGTNEMVPEPLRPQASQEQQQPTAPIAPMQQSFNDFSTMDLDPNLIDMMSRTMHNFDGSQAPPSELSLFSNPSTSSTPLPQYDSAGSNTPAIPQYHSDASTNVSLPNMQARPLGAKPNGPFRQHSATAALSHLQPPSALPSRLRSSQDDYQAFMSGMGPPTNVSDDVLIQSSTAARPQPLRSRSQGTHPPSLQQQQQQQRMMFSPNPAPILNASGPTNNSGTTNGIVNPTGPSGDTMPQDRRNQDIDHLLGQRFLGTDLGPSNSSLE